MRRLAPPFTRSLLVSVLAVVAVPAGAIAREVLRAAPAVAAADVHVDFDGDGFGDVAIPVVGEQVAGETNAGALHVAYGTASGLLPRPSQLWSQASPIWDVAESGDKFGAASSAGDFDHDGFDDLAVGVPGENSNAGAVNILYGSADGLTNADNRLFWQNTPGLDGDAQPLDGFGYALNVGDFDDDDFDDLAIGAPLDASLAAGAAHGGSVTILYGSVVGLDVTDSAVITQDTADVPDDSELADLFGSALAAGDVDQDGFDDLAVGAKWESSNVEKHGTVTILHGSAAGLTGTRSRALRQGLDDLVGRRDADDNFGAALAIGRFDGGVYPDLAIGVPREDIATTTDAGAIVAVPGGPSGLRPVRATMVHAATPGVESRLQSNVQFGAVLASADFDGDGRDDLAIGLWRYSLELTHINAGALVTLPGGTVMLDGSDASRLIHQDRAAMIDDAQDFDWFGQYLAPVDANGDGRFGLLVGVPGEDIGAVEDAGAAHVLGADASGLLPVSTVLWSQETPGIGDRAEAFDLFGGAGQELLPPS